MYLPYGARIKITLKTEEKVVVANPLPRKKRDPRIKRDPRRKAVSLEQQEENALLTENSNPGAKKDKPGDDIREVDRVVEPKNLVLDLEEPVYKEEAMEKEKEKIEKLENLVVDLKEPEETAMEEKTEGLWLDLEKPWDKEHPIDQENNKKPENLLQILKALPLPIDPDEIQEVAKEVVCIKVESDSSDDEKLQIDESFDESETSALPDPAPTTYLEKVQRSEETLEETNELWNEVCTIRNSGAQPLKAFDVVNGIKKETEEEEEEVTIVAEMKQLDMKKAPNTAEKSSDQLEVEKELLRKLVEERERLKATLAEAGILQEDFPTINFDEVEEGELSDSYDNEEEDKVESLSGLGNPENPGTSGIDLPEPIENRFKKYWDDFPEPDQGPKC